jgi:NADP-dependent 3-hydroxy acid dehydrogenase YdfG
MLVNNAGLGYEAALEELTREQWHSMFGVNVDGMFHGTRNVLPKMKESGYGHIINISSVAGTTGIPNMTGYCSTKFAVRGFSKCFV